MKKVKKGAQNMKLNKNYFAGIKLDQNFPISL